MRNLHEKLICVIARPLLLALLLFLPLSATYCHAQCWSPATGYPPIYMTMTPYFWTAGQSYTVTVSDTHTSDGSFTDTGNCNMWVENAATFDYGEGPYGPGGKGVRYP